MRNLGIVFLLSAFRFLTGFTERGFVLLLAALITTVSGIHGHASEWLLLVLRHILWDILYW